MEEKVRVDPIERALELRNTLIRTQKKFLSKRKEVLVVDFSDTNQGKDNYKEIGLMPNIRTGEYVFRTKINIKEIDPIAMRSRRAGDMSKDLVDLRKMSFEEIEDFVKKSHFDFPLWFKYVPGFKMERVLDYNSPFIVQVGGCNFHDGTETGGCWYCYVDDKSNDGRIAKGKTWLGVEDLVNSMLAARKEKKEQYAKEGFDMDMKVLRISGGEPTLVLDYMYDVWKYIEKKGGLNIVGQADTNCSTGSIVDNFEYKKIYPSHILERLGEYPIKWLTAIKGVDDENIQSNVQSTATLKEQIYSLKRFIRAGLDIYPEMYNPQPASLPHYLALMDSQIENFALKIHIGSLQGFFGPTKLRLSLEAKRLGIDPESFKKMKQEEWDNNYNDGIAVLNDYLQKHYGVGYKEVVRPDVDLKVLKP